MCDPTALLDLVPGEGLLKRPNMDYNDYTYCYGAHRGCLLDNSAPRGPPDVPPRNPTMSRLNGRLPGSHAASDHERDPDSRQGEPSCLVRTPSGNFYNIPKNPKNDYNNKNQSTGNSPIKVELQNNMDRVSLPYGHTPSMIPMRRQSIRCHFRKGIDWCSWKLIAIVVIMLSLCLTAALTYVAASNIANWSYQGSKPCKVVVGDGTEAKGPTSEAAKNITSSTTSSSGSRSRQPATTGGMRETLSSMVDRVFARKRRDTSAQHDPEHPVPGDTTNLHEDRSVAQEGSGSSVSLHATQRLKVLMDNADDTPATEETIIEAESTISSIKGALVSGDGSSTDSPRPDRSFTNSQTSHDRDEDISVFYQVDDPEIMSTEGPGIFGFENGMIDGGDDEGSQKTAKSLLIHNDSDRDDVDVNDKEDKSDEITTENSETHTMEIQGYEKPYADEKEPSTLKEETDSPYSINDDEKHHNDYDGDKDFDESDDNENRKRETEVSKVQIKEEAIGLSISSDETDFLPANSSIKESESPNNIVKNDEFQIGDDGEGLKTDTENPNEKVTDSEPESSTLSEEVSFSMEHITEIRDDYDIDEEFNDDDMKPVLEDSSSKMSFDRQNDEQEFEESFEINTEPSENKTGEKETSLKEATDSLIITIPQEKSELHNDGKDFDGTTIENSIEHWKTLIEMPENQTADNPSSKEKPFFLSLEDYDEKMKGFEAYSPSTEVNPKETGIQERLTFNDKQITKGELHQFSTTVESIIISSPETISNADDILSEKDHKDYQDDQDWNKANYENSNSVKKLEQTVFENIDSNSHIIASKNNKNNFTTQDRKDHKEHQKGEESFSTNIWIETTNQLLDVNNQTNMSNETEKTLKTKISNKVYDESTLLSIINSSFVIDRDVQKETYTTTIVKLEKNTSSKDKEQQFTVQENTENGGNETTENCQTNKVQEQASTDRSDHKISLQGEKIHDNLQSNGTNFKNENHERLVIPAENTETSIEMVEKPPVFASEANYSSFAPISIPVNLNDVDFSKTKGTLSSNEEMNDERSKIEDDSTNKNKKAYVEKQSQAHSEELQRDYPFNFYQDEVEIVKLSGEQTDKSQAKKKSIYTSGKDQDSPNDVTLKKQFKEDTSDFRHNSRIIMISRPPDDEEIFHPKAHIYSRNSSLSHSNSSISDSRIRPNLTHRVDVIEVPAFQNRTSLSSSRYLVNVTITAEHTGPLYTLSVSVPADGSAININVPQTLGNATKPGPTNSSAVSSESELIRTRSDLVQIESKLVQVESKLVQIESELVRTGSELVRTESKLLENSHEALKSKAAAAQPPPPKPPVSPPFFCECPCPSTLSDDRDNNFSAFDETSTQDPFTEWKKSNDSTTTDALGEETISTDGSESSGRDFEVKCAAITTPLPPEPTILILEGGRTFPARSFPPDGTTFAQVALGQRLNKEIPPYSYWNMQFYQSEPAYVRFDYNIPRGASIGVYARRNALPTHTQYDLLEVLSGFKARTTRASHPSIKKEATHYMEPGHWFLSLYNDDGDPQEVSFIAVIAEDMTHNCPNGCSGKGECLLGHCQCNPGFGGEDCSESVCPVLCSQRGEYINGECQCNPGWKGKECSLRHDECEVPDCNGHGHCTNGKCSCVRGYKGKFCEEVDCPHPTCSGHGFCAEGTCICKKGWKGADCSQMDKEALQCLPGCSGHGNFDLETQTCLCEPMWSGDDCSKELCDLDCGAHGHCVDNACDCLPGWSGELCNLKQCDPRCNEHGQCKNGTCLCVTGWNGRHCTMEGCPNSCSGHGQCKANADAQWECRCYDGWDGKDCSVHLEQDCNDGRDNDKDGLIDCADPECCSNPACRSSQLCVSAPKPIDILLRKQPPAITASFFERMKFLIDDGSLQNYARQETFNESRSAVVRGHVVTSLGMGLMGVRVSTSTAQEGFTLTRDDGWFDLLVNGGGAVTLQFGRSPFKPQSHIVFVPWNEVVIIDKIVMSTADEKTPVNVPHACAAHDYDVMKPVVLATWKHGFQGACPDKSAILAESQVIQESLQIPGTGLNLVYHSSRAAGYLSTIQLQLTPETIPTSLNLIHLRITIEGILFEKTFEADPVIKFTYAWNRLNVYRQRVYGVTTAMVKVGYEYSDCKDIIWDVQTTKLSGHDMSISEVGGWNLDIHHRYNFHEGILQKGDGSNIYLKHKPRVILTSMGDGHQRPLDCFSDCDGQATKQRLLAPVALATSSDGSIFVGDFNLIRKILVDGTVKTVVRLNVTRVSYRYHIAISPLDGSLYISDPESHQIIRVRDTNEYSDPEHNWETVVGSGERCLPGDEAHCGDGALARDAKLAYPKGVAISADNVLYFADGTNIRMVDRDGIITTIIGNHMHKSHWKPIPCEGTLNVEEVHLRWPTELAINPLDNSLHMIDDHMVLQLAPDGRVKVVAGRPLHCASPSSTFDTELATHATLVMPQSIAFGPSGNLYIAESDSQRINRVRVIGTDGKISPYAGAESKCNCLERGCDCFEADHYLASTSKFNTISAVAVSPDGVVHIGDQANYRIRSVMASIPDASGVREYELYSPDTQEIYVFNRYGQHIATKNILTGETVYLFAYNVNTSNGKLSTVTDAAGNKVFLLRDYSSQVNSIENTKGQKCRLRMSRMKMLHELSTPDNYNVTFEYHGPTGLLKTKLDSTGRSFVYNYDEFGRLTTAVTPTGKIISLTFDLSLKGATVKVGQNNRKPVSMLIKGSSVVTKVGEAEQRTTVLGDGSVGRMTPWSHTISTDTMPYTILAEIEPLLGESCPVPAKQRTEIAGDLANRFEWRYFLRKVQGNKNRGSSKAVAQVGRKLRVNGEVLLSLEYDRETNTVAVFKDDRVELLNVTYDRTSRPVKWGPRDGIFAGVDLEYDRFSRLTSWTWGDISETYGFDRAGRLYEIKYSDGTSMVYAFKDMFSSLPLKVTTPRGSDYLLQYDEAGALQSLTTPRGHIHAFSLQTSFGFYKYQYFSPMNRHPYEILYNDDGQILAKVYPHQSGKVAYVYDHTGKLETTLAGLSSIHYTYQETTSLVRSIDINEPNFEIRVEYKYHAGIVKDEKIKYGSKSGLDNAHYRYQYDGNARISGIDVDINGKQLQQIRLKYDQNLGVLEGVNDLRIYRNLFNRSVMQDSSKQFFTVTDYDEHGRIKTILMNIRSLDVYRMELEYDNRNRIKMRKLMIGKESIEKKEWSRMDKITYNADGHVLEVADTDINWQYAYDENGNIIGVMEHKEKIALGYDSGDRVVQYGDVEFNSYDQRGFVVIRGEHKYRYNSRGQLTHAAEHKKFQIWYYYDDRGRLVAWNDDHDNVTQFFYANPKTPDLITHLHFPKSQKTFRYLYDSRDFLMTVETSEQRFYVATDQNGSPLALFDTNGNLYKEMRRTPFGKIIKDTNPDFYLPIDFHGGLFDPNTKLIYLNKRLYDPTVGQWMTPAWEEMANELTTPTDIFIYRFRNNDPINLKQNVEYMTDLSSWLKLYGYDISSMLGSEYTKQMVYQPSATITSPQLAPDFGVMSGLQCIVNRVHDKFSDLGFVPKPLLKLEPKTRNLLPRVAHRRAVFGEGILVSRIGGRALVSVVDGVNSVVQDVVTSVINNSYFLPLHFSVHDQDVFYFVKDNALKIRDDMEELRRLGGMFNVSTHETSEHGSGTYKELRLHSLDAAVVIRYGADPEQERHRILKHAHKRAVERAWEIEKQLVATGFQGRGDWTKEEKEELISRGIVDGYEGVDIHSVHRYPQLADDPGNVAFTRDTKRKRRKSGNNRRGRVHRHDS